MKYYLLFDKNTQWFIKLLTIYGQKLEQNTKIEEIDFNFHAGGEFLDSIFSREEFKTLGGYYNANYAVWSISEYEFNRLKRINELYPLLEEYKKLTELGKL